MRILTYEFMQRALLASALVGVSAPAIGVFLVQRKLSLMGDGIGHVAFLGVAAGFLFGIMPLVTAMVAAALGAAAIEILRQRGRTASDVALAVVFYGGIAGGAIVMFLSGKANASLGYLFGSVLTVRAEELPLVAVVCLGVLVLTTAMRKELFAVCYDEEVARVSGLPVRKLNMLIALTAALMIGVTMKVVGLLLVSALLVLPVATAQRITSSFRGTVIAAVAIGGLVGVGGLIVAFYADLLPGGTIVLLSIALFTIATFFDPSGRGWLARGRA